MEFKVAESFLSINGEGIKAGELAVFIRMHGCNLSCSYCDTAWANAPDTPYRSMTTQQIVEQVRKTKVKNVTLTGGEPLLQEGIKELLSELARDGCSIEIETNGSIPLKSFLHLSPRISFTMDYKLAGSNMEDRMLTENLSLLTKRDTVKFVVSGREDLERAYEVAERFLKGGKCHILLSPVFGRIEPEEIVEFMKERIWTAARMQIQLHKVIWNPEKRGV